MTDTQKRVERLELAVLDCLEITELDTEQNAHLVSVFNKLEAVVGFHNEHLQSAAAKRRVKKPEPATP